MLYALYLLYCNTADSIVAVSANGCIHGELDHGIPISAESEFKRICAGGELLRKSECQALDSITGQPFYGVYVGFKGILSSSEVR